MHDIFYFTDVHGQLDLFQTMRDWCYKQDPECIIIYGGDACDRGDYGYDIMQMILDDPHMVYLKGNHEDLFVKAAREIAEMFDDIYNHPHTLQEAQAILESTCFFHNTSLHIYNGGNPTLLAWLLDGASKEFVDAIDNLPLVFSTDTCDFCHAGGGWKAFDEVSRAAYEGRKPNAFAADAMIWDRDHLNVGWKKDRILVHGHTPTCLLHPKLRAPEDTIKPVAWQGLTSKEAYPGWRIDMDTGMTWTGRGYILNVLTMTVTGFWDHDVGVVARPKAPVEQEFEKFKII
jgi:hypothetical protein